jgi:hypothetical protein
MSERGVGQVEREALDRARALEVAQRRGYYARLELFAELDGLDVAGSTGERSTQRLLGQLWHIDPTEAGRLRDEAADLVARVSLAGEVLAPRLPCTATVLAAGEIEPGHVAIIRRTMTRLDKVDTVSVGQWVAAERFLAEKATRMGPRGLGLVAKALLDTLDPDGAAPPEGEDRFDELHVLRRKDGSLVLRAKLHDPLDGEAFVEVIDDLAPPVWAGRRPGAQAPPRRGAQGPHRRRPPPRRPGHRPPRPAAHRPAAHRRARRRAGRRRPRCCRGHR